jgi:hypothetical protein
MQKYKIKKHQRNVDAFKVFVTLNLIQDLNKYYLTTNFLVAVFPSSVTLTI